jgi:uncharacterized protein
MNPVVHFEMPYEDKNRMADFYTKAFGWQPQMLGDEMGGYVVMTTSEMGENHMPKEPGRINGGFFKKTQEHQTPSVVIAVDDIKQAIKKVTEAGGKVLGASKGMNPDNIPGVGLYISIQDPEGNKVALLQPKPMMEAGPK